MVLQLQRACISYFTAHKLCQYPNALSMFKNKLLELSTRLKCTNVKITLQDLQGRFFHTPVVTCVKGDDTKSDHTIVVYKGYIFDGNFSHALPLSQTALDHCCSSREKSCKFVCFLNSFYLQFYENYMKIQKFKGQKKKRKRES